MVAEHYIAQENLFILHDHHRIRLAVERLGLSSLTEFKPQEKIIEWARVLLSVAIYIRKIVYRSQGNFHFKIFYNLLYPLKLILGNNMIWNFWLCYFITNFGEFNFGLCKGPENFFREFLRTKVLLKDTCPRFGLYCRYCIGSGKDGPLLSGSVRHFVDSLWAQSPTPGGGSASACIASMAAALGTMVSLGKERGWAIYDRWKIFGDHLQWRKLN